MTDHDIVITGGRVMDPETTFDAVANVGITIFALPLVFLGPFGGRLAQRVGAGPGGVDRRVS